MKKIFGAIAILIIAGSTWWVMRPSGFETDNPLTANGAPIDFLNGLDTNALADGWVHRKFTTISAADYQVVADGDGSALQCTTANSASILARDTQILVAAMSVLTWEWKVTQTIESDVDEATQEGDDHPARLFLVFSNEENERKAMEIIWSNRQYEAGDYKIIGDFYHYVANGLDENAGTWHVQSVDLQQLYTDIGGTGVPTLEALGFFCDSDNTGLRSEALFRNVILSPVPE